ncbi:MAG: M28 family peptidase [Crocinitomicaceae bacterium]|nr:M28 family peptidase [Crocinitomicaceae bacterium]
MRLFAVTLMVIVSTTSLARKVDIRYADTAIIKSHLQNIINTEKPRHFNNPDVLNKVSAYIFKHFKTHCDTVFYQNYKVDNNTYRNVVARIGPKGTPKIVVGAHYDVCGEQDGADDNASGVVGLLELVRLLSADTLPNQIEFVAYTLEEPPYFRTPYMGSHIHAKSIYESQEDILGMICLEMIGYFSDERKSQNYPLGILKMIYGGKGDYITIVQKFKGGEFSRKFKRRIKRQNRVKTKSFKGPAKLQGIDFSDHLNYWKYEFSAVMVTNTGFYRNKNYHQITDTIETLDLNRMALVIDQVYMVLKQWK